MELVLMNIDMAEKSSTFKQFPTQKQWKDASISHKMNPFKVWNKWNILVEGGKEERNEQCLGLVKNVYYTLTGDSKNYT